MAFDVFISYASKDKTVADAVCARLEAAGIRCWIAPRDIVAGTSYGEAIIDAIHAAKVMVLVFSANANASGHIPKEVERAVSNGVAILPFRIEDVAPGKSLDYFIGSVHWLDAMTPPMEQHLDDLAATVHKLIPESAQGTPLAANSDLAARHDSDTFVSACNGADASSGTISSTISKTGADHPRPPGNRQPSRFRIIWKNDRDRVGGTASPRRSRFRIHAPQLGPAADSGRGR